MFKEELLKDIIEAQSKDEPIAMAVVVRREAPTSGKPGDKATINTRGEVHGWIGGGCTKGIVIKEALLAIKEQCPRLVRIQNDTVPPHQPGVKNYTMSCASGGTVEIYIEPIMPMIEIQIFGRSHIAKALCKIAHVSGFKISVISDLADHDMFPEAENIIELKDFKAQGKYANRFAVVCTQGENDELSLQAAIETDPYYVGFVASRKKANAVLMSLKRQGISHEKLVKVKTPAGLDIQAKTPEEVALSILAEIVQLRRSSENQQEQNNPGNDIGAIPGDIYINPVCQVPVQKSTAKHVVEYQGEKVYFCCDGCKESFEKEPGAYL